MIPLDVQLASFFFDSDTWLTDYGTTAQSTLPNHN
jgi:hypothetical protein